MTSVDEFASFLTGKMKEGMGREKNQSEKNQSEKNLDSNKIVTRSLFGKNKPEWMEKKIKKKNIEDSNVYCKIEETRMENLCKEERKADEFGAKVPFFFLSQLEEIEKQKETIVPFQNIPKHLVKFFGLFEENAAKEEITSVRLPKIEVESVDSGIKKLPLKRLAKSSILDDECTPFVQFNEEKGKSKTDVVMRPSMSANLRAKLMAVASGTSPKHENEIDQVINHIRRRSAGSSFDATNNVDFFLGSSISNANGDNKYLRRSPSHVTLTMRQQAAFKIQRWWRRILTIKSDGVGRQKLSKFKSVAFGENQNVPPRASSVTISNLKSSRPDFSRSNSQEFADHNIEISPAAFTHVSFSLTNVPQKKSLDERSVFTRRRELFRAYLKGFIIRRTYHAKETRLIAKQIKDVYSMLLQLVREHFENFKPDTGNLALFGEEQQRLHMEKLESQSFFIGIKIQFGALKAKYRELFFNSNSAVRKRLGIFRLKGESQLKIEVAADAPIKSQKIKKKKSINLSHSVGKHIPTPVAFADAAPIPAVDSGVFHLQEKLDSVIISDDGAVSADSLDQSEEFILDDGDKSSFNFLKKHSVKKIIIPKKVDWSNVKAKTVHWLDPKIAYLKPAHALLPSLPRTISKVDLTKVKKRIDNGWSRDDGEIRKMGLSHSSADLRSSKSKSGKFASPHESPCMPKKSICLRRSPEVSNRANIPTKLRTFESTRKHSITSIVSDDFLSGLEENADHGYSPVVNPAARQSDLAKQEEVSQLDLKLMNLQQNLDISMQKIYTSAPLHVDSNSSVALFNRIPPIVHHLIDRPEFVGVIESQIERLKSMIRNEANRKNLTFAPANKNEN